MANPHADNIGHLVDYLPVQSVWIGLGMLAGAAFIALVGRRHAVARLDALGLFAASVLLGGAMSRIFWVLLDPGVRWGWARAHLWELADPRRGGHSSLGALAGGALVLGLWWMGARGYLAPPARQRVLDVLVPAGLLGLALARVGCLADGCDFGRLSRLPWAVRHPAGSVAWGAHVDAGLIAPDAPASWAVHPYALYLALGVLGTVAWAGLKLWRGAARPGTVALGALMSWAAWRFLVEWTRSADAILSVAGVLNIHQVLALLILGAALGLRKYIRV